MLLQSYLDAMGIQTWALKSKTQTIYALVSDEEYAMTDAARSLLHAMLASIDLHYEQIFTSESLKKQIGALQPRLLLILGSCAAHQLLNCDIPIEDLREKVHAYANIPTLVTHHPSYLLQNPKEKCKTYEDLCMARHLIAR